jgi:hypothetical protein
MRLECFSGIPGEVIDRCQRRLKQYDAVAKASKKKGTEN